MLSRSSKSHTCISEELNKHSKTESSGSDSAQKLQLYSKFHVTILSLKQHRKAVKAQVHGTQHLDRSILVTPLPPPLEL